MSHGASRPVVLLSWLTLALLAGHDITHLADEGLDTSAGQLALVAIPQWIVLGAVMAVILRGDRMRSGLAALLLGAGTALGFAVVHLLPFAPAAYGDLDPSTASWALAWVPTATGLALAALAWPQLRPALHSRPAA